MSKTDIKWYRLDDILKYEAQYYMIYGERSNGKSFAVDEYILNKFFEHGEEFAILKRYEEDMKGKYMENLFPLELLERIEEKYNKKVKFYRGVWYCYDADKDWKLNSSTKMGYAFSLSNVNRTKATTYPKITTILFEEFMSIDCKYLKDEINLLLNTVSTIARHRHNVKIFMLANAISKYSPYSDALSIRLHRIEKGKIITREYKDERGFITKFAIQRSENVNVFDNSLNKDKIVYNNFGNSGVGQMITTGDFEVHSYKKRVDNVTFSELKLYKDEKLFEKSDKIPFILKFEDYYYRLYLKRNNKFVLGFREVNSKTISNRNTMFVLNGIDNDIKGVPIISNIASYNDERINNILNIIVGCIREGDFIALTNDDGENIVNGFRQGNINV